jgi:hypothetical protein
VPAVERRLERAHDARARVTLDPPAIGIRSTSCSPKPSSAPASPRFAIGPMSAPRSLTSTAFFPLVPGSETGDVHAWSRPVS